MKFTTLQENLKNGLNVVERMVGRNPSLPILNNILLETEKNFLKLSSTDLEIGISYWTLVKMEKEGKIAVPAKILKDFIGILPNKKINFEVKNSILYIDLENFSSQIKGFSSEEFPIIPQVLSDNSVEIDSEEFVQGLSQVCSIAAPSQVRPEISGVFLSFFKNSIKLVATDSFRLSEKTLSFEKKLNKECSFIIPQKTCQELIFALEGKEGMLKICPSTNQVLFETSMEELKHPQFQIVSRLIEGEYPNYQEIIPVGFKTQIVLPREEFSNQIKIASLFSGKVNEIKLKADPSKETIEIFSQSSEFGENRSQIKGKIKGEKVETSFNWKFLQDGLLNIKSSEIVLEINSESGPGVLKPVGDSSYIYIVMPIKGS